jgi:flagellar protein FlbD
MISLHRLTHPEQTFLLNPDLIQTVEATPDTVIALTNSSKFIVIETPLQVVELIREWRGSIIGAGLGSREAEKTDLAQIVHLAGSRAEPGD